MQGKACQSSHASKSSVRIHNYKDAFHSYSLFQPPHQDEIQYHKNFQWKGVHTGTVAVTVAVLIIVLQLKQGGKNPALPFQLRRQAFFITPPKIISLCFEVWFEASAPNLLSNLGLFDDPFRLPFRCIN